LKLNVAVSRKKQIAAAILGAVFLATGAAALFHAEAPAERNLATVQKGSFEIRLQTVGVLDASRAFQVVSALPGDRGKIIQIVEDGARVEKGDIVLRFDPTPFDADVHRLSGELKSREAVVEYARQSLEVEKSQADKALNHEQFDLTTAKQEMARYLAYIADLHALQKNGHDVVSEIAQAGRKTEQVSTQLQKLEADLARVQKEVVYKIGQATAELNKASNELATTHAALVQAQDQLDKSTVRAPLPGFVVLNEIFQGNQKRKPRAGDTVWQGQAPVYLPDLSSMVVKTQLREEDLQKIKAGLAATVRIDAYPDALFEGEVGNVGVLAMDPAGTSMVGKYFQYTVSLKGSDPRLRPGMTARVSIVASSARDVLTVPLAALFSESEGKVCFVFNGQKLIPKLVRVGRMNEDVAEILDGLKEGDRVALVRP
jgi:HlyD family secretion protein